MDHPFGISHDERRRKSPLTLIEDSDWVFQCLIERLTPSPFSGLASMPLDAASSNPRDVVGAIDALIPFGLTELAEVMDMGSQCAAALANLPLWRRSPTAFWRQVDMKRFGTATWTKDVEAENARLRTQLHGRN